ncbi:MAG: DUF6702 family protein [Flavobacteriales bacterium]
MRFPVLIASMLFTMLTHTAMHSSNLIHDFHYSRMSWEWNAQSNTWQGILRVFTDDLELALSKTSNESFKWRLGDELEHPDSDSHIARYFMSHWKIMDAELVPLTLHYVGKEVDYDITYLYIESDPTAIENEIILWSDGFCELFEDQVNEAATETPEASGRHWLTCEDPSQRVKFSEDD